MFFGYGSLMTDGWENDDELIVRNALPFDELLKACADLETKVNSVLSQRRG